MSKNAYPGYPGLDGPTFPAHTPEQIQELRARTAPARKAQESHMPPPGAVQVATAPDGGRVVDAVLAGRLRDRAIGELQADLARYDRELQRPSAMGANGLPLAAGRQQSLQAGIESCRREVERLAALSGEDLIAYAVTSGRIGWLQNGSAVVR